MPVNRIGRRMGGAANAVVARWLPRRPDRSLGSFWKGITPAQLLVLSFLGLNLIGTVGFRVLPGLYTGERLSWIDALFTATSAVCVTGLIVVDTATFFTPWGQAWIIALVQAGGLGLLTLTSLILLTVGRRVSLRHQSVVPGSGEGLPTVDVRRLIRLVLRTTFLIEAGGAVLLYGAWVGDLGWGGAIWPSVFHSISAFCNAGFSTFSLSLMGETQSPLTLLTVMGLVVLGGLGFLTISELSERVRGDRKRRRRLSLHTRFVLVATAVAVVSGLLTFAYFEWENTLREMPVGAKIMNAAFASVAARTAGFNTVDFAQITAPSALLMMILMFVGGAPASTAGGIKVTTAALLGTLMVARMRGQERVSIWNRSVPDETIGRAIGLTILAVSVVVVALFFMVALEAPADARAAGQEEFVRYAFEVVSAFGTVGLSMNTTTTLSEHGRLLAVALMFIGRVGILSFGAAIALSSRRRNFRYAYEDVAIG